MNNKVLKKIIGLTDKVKTMADKKTIIKLKTLKESANRDFTEADLAQREIGFNEKDNGIYVRRSDGEVVKTRSPNPGTTTLQYNSNEVGSFDGNTDTTINFEINAENLPLSSTDNTSVSDKIDTKLDIAEAETTYATKAEIPTELPNPEALTINYNGVQIASYDGSTAETGNFIVNAETVPMSDSDDTTISVELAKKLDSTTADSTYAKKSEIPTKLPNPEALTVTVNNKSFVSYDGSTAVTQDLVMNAETIPLNADTTLTVAYGLEQVTPLVAQIPIRTLQDKVYDQETILGWFGQESVADIKQKIVRNVPVFVKYGIQLSGNPHYYKFPVDYCAFESANQIKMVFQGLNTKNDVVSKYEIIINLDGTIIEGNSNVKVTITSLETSSYNNLTDKPSINNVELSGNKTLENLGIQPAGEYLVASDIANKADKATTLAGYGITDAYTKLEVDSKLSTVYKYKGSVATYEELPSANNEIGDVYNVETDGMNYAWDGTTWDKLGVTVDLSNYYTKPEVNTELDKKLDITTASSTYATITTVNGKADKATTLAGYGITDAYTSSEVDSKLDTKQNTLSTEQLAAVNSGITAEHITSYDAYAGEISAAQLTADKADKAAEVAQQTANLVGTNLQTVTEKIPTSASSSNLLVDTNAMNTALANKANTSDLGTMSAENASDYSTKAVADTLYAPIRKSVTDTSSTTITLANADANTVYHYGTLDSLTITAADVSDLETIIWFTPSANLTNIVIPDTIKPMNEFKPISEKLCCVSILNGTVVYGSIL